MAWKGVHHRSAFQRFGAAKLAAGPAAGQTDVRARQTSFSAKPSPAAACVPYPGAPDRWIEVTRRRSRKRRSAAGCISTVSEGPWGCGKASGLTAFDNAAHAGAAAYSPLARHTSACLISAAWYAVMGGSEATPSARLTISERTFARRASLCGSHPSSFRACLT